VTRDDYLWDPHEPPDAELQALERTLAPLRHDGRELDAERLPPQRRASRRRWPLAAAALAAAVLAVFALWPDAATLRPGAGGRRFVAGAEAVTIALGELAQVTVMPNSDLWFAHWRADEARFRLRSGSIGVRVAPPPAVAPKFFCVDTPGGSVVDLGCRYLLQVRADGTEHVRVTEGAVQFAYPQRQVFVPAGAECTVQDGRPGTPLFTDTDGKLRDLVGKFDSITAARASAPQPVPRMDREKLAAAVAMSCRAGRDTLVLWHLLRDDESAIRLLAEARLVELEGAPPGCLVDKFGRSDADPELWLAYLRLGAWTMPR
jgi:FecR protein